ncbi:NAD(P)/FAD-dependent oxidoreductase [Streptomyces sp. NPDC087787]|uniref:NAD(P)/FAD-dependent oxidoreductase n=1 Tax=Streptomyces sp. NPDC087787 TaxID=3365803 RepID=UPI00382564B9
MERSPEHLAPVPDGPRAHPGCREGSRQASRRRQARHRKVGRNLPRLRGRALQFPAQRVACTPLGDRLRVAGMMEFRKPEAPLDARRVHAMAEAARPLLRGADLDARRDEWVGSRPCTTDGLPLIGATRSPRVFAAGGHGMWGITLGPATGRLLAETIVTGELPAQLAPFDPLR